MYKSHLQVHGEQLAKAQTLPANTTAAGNGDPQRVGGNLTGMEVVMRAATPCAIANGKVLTITISESDDNSTWTPSPVAFSKTFGAAKNFAKDDVMARLPLPSDGKRFVKCTIGTDDAAATGTVDVYIERLR